MTNHLEETVNALNVGSVPSWISVHVNAYERSGGAEGHMWDSTAVGGSGLVPCLLLTTVGRKSGNPYTHPLLYGVDDQCLVIVASKGGSETQPQWYFNLLANPNVSVQVKADKFRARATLAQGAVRERLWQVMTEVYPTYLEYQAKTSRELPVFRIERLPD
jgi:deazaflavin-dependent oxidoreductase (nitroreductase family)